MAKSRDEDKQKPDDLEIISIGFLYRGPWEKKYWSCSRGKDRYPYPVGFEAVRAHDGNRCKMEIREGSKGPVFVITSADGHSYSGETPAIAWENFQKKCFPHMKIWHGKRFSCKVDGVQFFGFKNPFVQRLLRELVANLDGVAEQSLIMSSGFCDGASVTEKERERRSSDALPDLLTYLAKPLRTGRRRQRCHKAAKKLEIGVGLKRLEMELLSNANASDSRKKRQKNCRATSSMHSDENDLLIESPVAFQKQGNSNYLSELGDSSKAAEGGSNLHTCQKVCPVDSVEFCTDVGIGAFITEENKPDCPRTCISIRTLGSSFNQRELLDRLKDNALDQLKSVTTVKDNGEAGFAPDSMGINDAILFVNDTLDELQDNTCGNALTTHKESHSVLEDDSTAANIVITEDLGTESHPEEEMGTYLAGGSSERNDFDSVGQEVAKSMMTVLLPQAVPLLKKYSRKKKAKRDRMEENSSTVPKPGEDGSHGNFVNSSSPKTDATSIGSMQMKQQNLPALARHVDFVISKPEHIDSAALEDDKCGHQANYQDIPDSLDTSGRASTLYHEKLQYLSDKKPQEDETYLHGRITHLNIPYNESYNSENISASLGKDIASSKEHSNGDLKVVNDYIADENNASTSIKKADDETSSAGNGPTAYIPRKVLARKYEGPLSESIVCRNSTNGHILETYYSNADILPQEIHQFSSDDQINNLSYDTAELVLHAESNVLPIPAGTPEAKDKLNTLPILGEHQAPVGTSNYNNASSSFIPSGSHVEEFQPSICMNLDEHKNSAHSEDSIPYQRHASGFSDPKEDQSGLLPELKGNMKLNNELDRILEPVGCYSHSLPILSVMLRSKGNEIYACVQCGSRVDESRTLFLCKLLTEKPTKGYPFFIGHTSVLLPSSKRASHRGIKTERSWCQITPDGRNLVILGDVKVPFCREGRISCLCSTCTSMLLDVSAVRIVRIDLGYVTVALNLKTVDKLLSIMICEPNYLVAIGESGRLHLWTMNLSWSGHMEEFDIPTYDPHSPCIVELHKVPKCTSLVVGYNGFGEFTLWDISRRMFLSKFSAPSTLLHDFLPISSLSYSWKGLSSSESNDHINEIMASTKKSFQNFDESPGLKLEGEEIAVWILVSAAPDVESDYQANASKIDPVAWWRLALLAKNVVTLGSPLDARAVSIGALSGHGVLGTSDGLVYMWDLSTGSKIGDLNHFKGGGVSCIATDDSTSSVLAVAGENGELMVYQCRQGSTSNSLV